MKSFRFLQRNALRQLAESGPALRQTFAQLQGPTQQSFRTRPLRPLPLRRSIHTSRINTNTLSQSIRRRTPTSRRFNSTTPTTTNEKLSLSQRLKKLSREYGWTAVGLYFALSALDFPFCFLAVRWVGTDVIGHYEHVVLSKIKSFLKWPLPHEVQEEVDGASDVLKEKLAIEEGAKTRILEEDSQSYIVEDHGYKEAEIANRGDNASLWTQLALAYAIHKSFIFLRVPLTAALLPKVVKTLRSWGYNIGKVPSKKALTAAQSSSKTGVNTKGSKVKPDD